MEAGETRAQAPSRERAAAIILVNYEALSRLDVSFTQPLNIRGMLTQKPYLELDDRRRVLRVSLTCVLLIGLASHAVGSCSCHGGCGVQYFAKANVSDKGFVDFGELEKFAQGGCPGIGDSVFLPMLFDIIPVRTWQR